MVMTDGLCHRRCSRTEDGTTSEGENSSAGNRRTDTSVSSVQTEQRFLQCGQFVRGLILSSPYLVLALIAFTDTESGLRFVVILLCVPRRGIPFEKAVQHHQRFS